MSEEVVGPILGPVSDLEITALGYTPNGVQWDYAIGGLPFMDAAHDEHPYARETAQFRKEQVDQSRSVGDQSLTGYWTRGQLSFHRGAGLNFYEVLEGDAIPNRFNDARNVDIWEPGVVTVKAPHTEVSTDQIQDALLFHTGFASMSAAGGISLRDFDGTVDSALPSSDAAAFSSMTSDGTNLYAINDDMIEKCEPGGSFSVLWTGTGLSLSQVFWAKSRLWVVDSAGEWWTLEPVTGGSFATGDGNTLWKSNIEDADWSLADAPNGVYLAAKNTVYLSTWATSTASLTVPASVASVGAQEHIGNLGFYLGYLLVFSDKGARLGAVRDDQVVLGDKFLEADFADLSRLAYRDSLVLATGTNDDGATVLYELNPLDQTTDLAPAWATVRDVDAGSGASGALVFPDDRVLTFCSAGSINTDDEALGSATGYVQTALHRFGTLEPKDFRTVSVRVEGTVGSVGVEVVRADGTATSIVTLGPENFASNEIDLRLPGVTDAIGLRFTLTASGGVSPRLLGYQLRAVPAPPRQRLIQVPLLCKDTEKVGTVTRGRRGRAYERLARLEEMERTSGVVRFQDFITGEVAQVVVENVSFRRPTPASVRDKANWGGVIVVTLRKVA